MHLITDERGLGFRLFTRSRGPVFEFSPRWGLRLNIEFPSDWHEECAVHLSFCFVWGLICIMLPWYRRYDDHGQCSGPQYGFAWYPEALHLHYGNDDGTPEGNRTTIVWMPWNWELRRATVLSGPESFAYTYQLRDGSVQHRTAAVYSEERELRRWWLPRKRVYRSIVVSFDEEVGERSGSWKGGVLGCGYTMLPGETPRDTLRRMERERKFD